MIEDAIGVADDAGEREIESGEGETGSGEGLRGLPQIREELLDDRAFFKSLFNSMPVGVLVLDSSGRVRAVNWQSVLSLGLGKEATEGRLWGELVGCAQSVAGDCGRHDSNPCQYCGIWKAIKSAWDGVTAGRQKVRLRSGRLGRERLSELLVEASISRIGGEEMCVVILEEVAGATVPRQRERQAESFAGIVGRDPRMQSLFHTIRDLAERDVPVLIQGESGTGKELVASAIHMRSPRSKNRFVAVNCGAIPEALIESELFGHAKGAFTGAIRDKRGRFELASGGTLFLDEVGELSPMAQVKLLRVLQEGAFEPVGSERTVKVDVRIVSATNRDLEKEMREGRFRSDLYYRICVVPVFLPPLRERPLDIPLLADHLLGIISERSGQGAPGLSPEALPLLMAHPWPGNVRELENALQCAAIQSKGGPILPEHLCLPKSPDGDQQVQGLPDKPHLDMIRVRQALRAAGGNRLRAAKLLEVSRSTLYRFIGLHRPLLAEREGPWRRAGDPPCSRRFA